MRRILIQALLVCSGFLLTACLTIEEKLTVQSDGSGEILTTIDLGEMLSNPMIKMAMLEEMKKNGEEIPERVDSVINLVEEMKPNNPQWTAADLALLDNIDARMTMDFEASEGAMTIRIPFGNFDELEAIQKLMSEAEQEGSDSDMFGPMGTGSMAAADYGWKKGTFSRVSSVTKDLFETMGMKEDEMGMMEMMFGEAELIYQMEMPGKIKKVKGFPGHEVDGNLLTQRYGFLEVIKKPELIDEGLDGQIKYRK